MKKFKRLIAIVTVLLFALTIVAPAFAQDEATTTNPVYDDAAKVLKDKGVMQGNESGDLMLDKTLTRAEVVKMILVATGQEEVAEEYADADASFSDTQDHWAKKYIEAAKELGIVSGYPDGTFKPEQPVKFEELCKLLVAAVNETPAAGKWPLNYVKKALDLGLFNGIEDELSIGQVVVRGQAAVGFAAAFFPPEKPAPIVKDVQPVDNTTFTVTVEAYAGYTLEDGDVTAADFEVKDAADETKTLAVKDATLDVATGKVTVKTDAQVAGKTYKVFFRGQDTTKTFAGAPVALTVTDVSTDNLKTVTIKFNDTLDSTTVSKDNIKVSNHTVADAKLLSDNKTVLAILSDKFAQFEKVTVTVSNFKSANGKTVSTFSKDITVQDSKQPALVSVEATNGKTVKFTFSEPIDASAGVSFAALSNVWLSNVKIDSYPVVAASIASDIASNSVTITLNNALTKGTHNVDISDIYDYASYKISATTKSFDVPEDVTPPQVVAAKVTGKRSVEVTFNEGLDKKGTFTVNGITTTATKDQSDNTKVYLTLNNDLTAGITVLLVQYQDQTDVMGNKVASAVTFSTNIADDTVVPKVTFKLDTGNVLVFTFDKEMDTTKGTVTVSDKNGRSVTVSANGKFDSTKKILTIDAASAGLTNKDADQYNAKLTDFVDATLRANPLGEQNFTFTIADSKQPTVGQYYSVDTKSTADVSDDTVTLFFSEPMDKATIGNIYNYVAKDTYNNTTLPLVNDPLYVSGSLTVSSDGTSVTFGYKGTTNRAFIVSGVKDLAGNVIAGGYKEVSNSAVPALVTTQIRLVDRNTIQIDFNNEIKSISPLSLAVVDAAYGFASYISSATKVDADTVELKTINTLSSTDAKNYWLKVLDVNGIVDVYSKTLTNYDANKIVTTPLTDKAAPVFTVSAVTYGSTSDGLGKIEITATEAIYASDLNYVYGSIILIDKNGKSITINANNTVITTDGSGNITKITIDGDGNHNGLPLANNNYTISIIKGLLKDTSADRNDVTPVINYVLTLVD